MLSSARSVANGEEAARKLKEEGLTATYLQADVTDSASFSAIRDKLVKDHGGLDVLVNNAGTGFKVIQTSKLIHAGNVQLFEWKLFSETQSLLRTSNCLRTEVSNIKQIFVKLTQVYLGETRRIQLCSQRMNRFTCNSFTEQVAIGF